MRTGRFICEACGARYDEAGDCRAHPDEPLQDLASEDVRIMLDEFDTSRRRKRYGLLGAVALVVCSPLFVLLPFRKLAFWGWVGAAAGLTPVMFRFFPSRRVMPDLEAEKPAWLTGTGA